MNIRKELQHQLAKPSHIVKVQDLDTGIRLEKNAKNMRFAFSIDDINEEFGGIDELVEELKSRDFGNTRFLFQRVYGTPDKATYHTMKECITDLKQEEQKIPPLATTQDNAIPVQNTPPKTAPTAPQIEFLGAGANPVQYLGALVEAQRSNDYKTRIVELEEQLRDAKSKVRRLQEENHSMKLKVETVEEKAKLELQQKLLDKEGILEKQGTQKLLEGLAGMLPTLATMITPQSAPQTQALNAPALSPMQQQVFEMLKQATDEQSALVAYILANYNEELVSLINNYLQQNTPTQ